MVARSQSLPPGQVNPFWSTRVQAEVHLQAARGTAGSRDGWSVRECGKQRERQSPIQKTSISRKRSGGWHGGGG